MTPQDFCYWLQGKFEGRNVDSLPAIEVATIRDHLNLVFDKQTPDYDVEVDEQADVTDDKANDEINDLLKQWGKKDAGKWRTWIYPPLFPDNQRFAPGYPNEPYAPGWPHYPKIIC